jgi:hypothetical protein
MLQRSIYQTGFKSKFELLVATEGDKVAHSDVLSHASYLMYILKCIISDMQHPSSNVKRYKETCQKAVKGTFFVALKVLLDEFLQDFHYVILSLAL